jgi:hypothetical protein
MIQRPQHTLSTFQDTVTATEVPVRVGITMYYQQEGGITERQNPFGNYVVDLLFMVL